MDNEQLLLTIKNIYNALYELTINAANYCGPLADRMIRLSENIEELEKSIKKAGKQT